jgi:hypothetical protein
MRIISKFNFHFSKFATIYTIFWKFKRISWNKPRNSKLKTDEQCWADFSLRPHGASLAQGRKWFSRPVASARRERALAVVATCGGAPTGGERRDEVGHGGGKSSRGPRGICWAR